MFINRANNTSGRYQNLPNNNYQDENHNSSYPSAPSQRSYQDGNHNHSYPSMPSQRNYQDGNHSHSYPSMPSQRSYQDGNHNHSYPSMPRNYVPQVIRRRPATRTPSVSLHRRSYPKQNKSTAIYYSHKVPNNNASISINTEDYVYVRRRKLNPSALVLCKNFVNAVFYVFKLPYELIKYVFKDSDREPVHTVKNAHRMPKL